MNYWILVFILMSAIGFYNPSGIISPQVQKFFFYFSVVLGLVYSLIWGKNLSRIKYPRIPYFGMLIGICISIFVASTFNSQSIVVSAITTLQYILAYLCFWVFMKLDVPRHRIMNTLIVISFISAFVYFVNLAGAPYFSFGIPLEDNDLSRGILRIAIVYIPFFPLLLFYSINKWFETKKWKWIFYGVFLMIMIFMSVIRQIILLSTVLSLYYILHKVNLFNKIAVIGLAVLFGSIVLPRIPMYNTMLELSQEQKEHNDDEGDIRIKAWEFYTIEYQTNGITPIIGNGVPAYGSSPWGKKFEMETDNTKCFAVDVGWAGFYYYFGGFSTLMLLFLLLCPIFRKKPPTLQFTSYWFVYLILSSIASGQILYYFQIVCVSLVLYLVYKEYDDTEDISTITDNPLESKPCNGYPQLQSRTIC